MFLHFFKYQLTWVVDFHTNGVTTRCKYRPFSCLWDHFYGNTICELFFLNNDISQTRIRVGSETPIRLQWTSYLTVLDLVSDSSVPCIR